MKEIRKQGNKEKEQMKKETRKKVTRKQGKRTQGKRTRKEVKGIYREREEEQREQAVGNLSQGDQAWQLASSLSSRWEDQSFWSTWK